MKQVFAPGLAAAVLVSAPLCTAARAEAAAPAPQTFQIAASHGHKVAAKKSKKVRTHRKHMKKAARKARAARSRS
ncbi:MAG: hypothetical protein FJZ01_10260 [Candidatus Sericytochromatia bacterium]|nr:hypothetical protein [Candidatus Tanganyikabacteria bacterium]